MGHSSAVYDLAADVLRLVRLDRARLTRAFAAPVPVWHRVLGFEGCTAQVDRQLRARVTAREIPEPIRQLLGAATGASVRFGILAHRQLAEIAALATSSGIRVMAVKGAARLLAGDVPGTRSIADIDLLVAPGDGAHFHELLMAKRGYSAAGPAYAHHLPVLERFGSLNIDLHIRISDTPIALDTSIWDATRVTAINGHVLELPSATNMVLHTLEHGLGLNWMGRYRLRDILDVAALYTADVSGDAVRSYIAKSRARIACETLLSAAHDLEPRVPTFSGDAWRTIRRVSRARLALSMLPPNPRDAERVFRYAGVIAEGSPQSIVRAGQGAIRRLATAFVGGRASSGRVA
jgi:hypothetical protein